MEINKTGAADPRGRDRQDPPAHLPRGQLLRRPHSRARRARRSCDDGDTIKITQTATPVQLDQVLTSLQSDSREDLKDAARRARDGAQLQADGGARTRPPTRRRAARPRRSPSTTPTTTSRRPSARRAQVVRGAARHRADARRRAADRAAPRSTTGALIRNESAAQGPDHQLQHDDGGVRRASRTTCSASIRAAARRRSQNANARVRRRSTPRSRRRARSRARSCPGVRETPATIDAVVPVDRADAHAASRRHELGGLAAGALAGRRADLAQLTDARDRAAAADRPRVAVRCATSSCPTGDLVDPRRVHDRRGELQGVLLRAGRARRRGPELRRQRHVRALPDRRRLADGLARPDGARAPASCSATRRRAARQPAGLPGQAPAVQARRALLQAEAAERQRPARRSRADDAADRAGVDRDAAPQAELAPCASSCTRSARSAEAAK